MIPLPDKVDVKTGEEDEEVLYSHRAKLYRFAEKEWKERGVGDVKILRHKTNGKLRVVMRRDQVLKICLNHVLDADVSYQKKDDKSWQFVANDFSEGVYELMNFSLRFKNAEIASEFKKAIDQALSGDALPVVLTNTTLDSTISTPTGRLNYSQLSDISLDDKELIDKLKLPADFFDSPKLACAGCRGCDPDSFVFPTYDLTVNKDLQDEKPLPVSVDAVKQLPVTKKLTRSPKKVSFSETTEDQKVSNLFGSLSTATTTTTKTDSKSSPFSISSFMAAEKQSSATIFGGAAADQSTPKSIFGGLASGTTTTTPATGSIFSSSLNTTPKTAILPPQGDKSKSPLLQPSVFGSASPSLNKSAEGVQLFGSSFGQNTSTSTSIFGGTAASSAAVAKSEPSANSTSNVTSPPLFGGGSNIFGGFGPATSTPTFGSLSANNTSVSGTESKPFASATSSFSFADAAKGFGKKSGAEPDLLKKMETGVSFASLASSGTETFLTKQSAPNSGFVGLTVKEDIFTRMANKNKNDSSTGENDDKDESGGGDENYDPHYEPIIQLPDEIEVRTGEEEETKLFGDRAKLYRYDSDTKEWKERGVGELKILHHPGRNSYRLLMRREQIFKLVLNHGVTSDLHVTPMNNSPKAFVWATMNHAEEGPQLEQLAARFKNEDVASLFKSVLDQCQEKLRQKPDLEPDQD